MSTDVNHWKQLEAERMRAENDPGFSGAQTLRSGDEPCRPNGFGLCMTHAICDNVRANLKELQDRVTSHTSELQRISTCLQVRDAQISMTVDRLGGLVEGQPTQEINFLQRVDELVAIEKEVKALRHACLAALGFFGGVSVLTKEQLEKTLADAVREYATNGKKADSKAKAGADKPGAPAGVGSQEAAFTAALAFLGWQGGNIHVVKRALQRREEDMIRQYNAMDGETDEQVILMLHRDIAHVQTIMMHLA